jgi:glycosyltransferase involved in cell wall biosynthesis
MSHIYVLSPDNNSASGGIKILYRHVDVLNSNGYDASVLHQNSGFRCTWFSNTTKIDYLNKVQIEDDDFLVIPEIFGPNIYNFSNLKQVSKKARKVIFNQNCRYTFLGQSIQSVTATDFRLPYDDEDQCIATMVVSDDSANYIKALFPIQDVFRIHNAINIDTFTYGEATTPQICFMPRKHADEAMQVLGALNIRGALKGVNVVAIDNMNEQQVADTMKDSMFFLSFGYPEGCPLPPAEAMASGCVGIGYDGFGGREYFKPEFSFPIDVGDIIGYADCVEKQLKQARTDSGPLVKMAKEASDYVRDVYSSKAEQNDILNCWHFLTNK